MFTQGKKPYETTEQKIGGYEEIIKFYERNSEGRFQTKSNLKKILNEIYSELDKDQTRDNLSKLYILQNRISRLV